MISPEKGMGATAEERLKQIAPLVEYFESEMGLGAGRLMLATNFKEQAQAWIDQTRNRS